jgi:hypothetical protein
MPARPPRGTAQIAASKRRRFFRDALCLEPVEEAAGLAEYRLADGSTVEVIRRGSALDHAHFTTWPAERIDSSASAWAPGDPRL